MRRKTLYTTQEVDVDVEYDVDFDDLLEIVESCNKEQREKIINKIVNTDDGKRMKTLTLYNEQEVDVDVEYDVVFTDLVDMITDCDDDELEEIRNIIDSPTWITSDNLYDEQKLKLLKTVFDKYSLEELEQRLK